MLVRYLISFIASFARACLNDPASTNSVTLPRFVVTMNRCVLLVFVIQTILVLYGRNVNPISYVHNLRGTFEHLAHGLPAGTSQVTENRVDSEPTQRAN